MIFRLDSGSNIPDGWEFLTEEEEASIISRPDGEYRLLINRSDPRAPIGMYIQWAPRGMDG